MKTKVRNVVLSCGCPEAFLMTEKICTVHRNNTVIQLLEACKIALKKWGKLEGSAWIENDGKLVGDILLQAIRKVEEGN